MPSPFQKYQGGGFELPNIAQVGANIGQMYQKGLSDTGESIAKGLSDYNKGIQTNRELTEELQGGINDLQRFAQFYPDIAPQLQETIDNSNKALQKGGIGALAGAVKAVNRTNELAYKQYGLDYEKKKSAATIEVQRKENYDKASASASAAMDILNTQEQIFANSSDPAAADVVKHIAGARKNLAAAINTANGNPYALSGAATAALTAVENENLKRVTEISLNNQLTAAQTKAVSLATNQPASENLVNVRNALGSASGYFGYSSVADEMLKAFSSAAMTSTMISPEQMQSLQAAVEAHSMGDTLSSAADFRAGDWVKMSYEPGYVDLTNSRVPDSTKRGYMTGLLKGAGVHPKIAMAAAESVYPASRLQWVDGAAGPNGEKVGFWTDENGKTHQVLSQKEVSSGRVFYDDVVQDGQVVRVPKKFGAVAYVRYTTKFDSQGKRVAVEEPGTYFGTPAFTVEGIYPGSNSQGEDVQGKLTAAGQLLNYIQEYRYIVSREGIPLTGEDAARLGQLSGMILTNIRALQAVKDSHFSNVDLSMFERTFPPFNVKGEITDPKYLSTYGETSNKMLAELAMKRELDIRGSVQDLAGNGTRQVTVNFRPEWEPAETKQEYENRTKVTNAESNVNANSGRRSGR